MLKRFILPVLLAGLLASCDAGLDGTPKDNLPPSTSFTVNSINLPENERLTSQINISWWGDDPDGYVVGYEFYIGDDFTSADVEWVFTTSTDSVFILPIEEGNTDADVRFTVRAIDNEGAVDPEPPSLVFPISNTAPEITFTNTELPPDTTYRVFSVGFRASDLDGFANLNRIEFAINDTSSWFAVDPDIQLLTFRSDDSQATVNTEVFTGRAATTTDIRLNSVVTDSDNTLYLRAVDNAGALSAVIEHEWYVKRQRSRVLLLNDYFGPNSAATETLHRNLLASVGITEVDYINITDGTATGGRRVILSRAFPNRALVVPTINKMMAEWDHIYWISDNLDRNIGYALEMTLEFFENGGTMFVNIPSKILFDDNPVLEFLPIERIQSPPPGRTFILQNNSVVAGLRSEFETPYLRFRRNLVDSFPVVPFGETVRLFEAPYRTRVPFPPSTTDFDGTKLISAVNPDNSVLFFGIDLNEFDQNERVVSGETLPASNLSALIEITCIDILKFEQ